MRTSRSLAGADKAFDFYGAYHADMGQVRVRLADLACLMALRDKERHATLSHFCIARFPRAWIYIDLFIGSLSL